MPQSQHRHRSPDGPAIRQVVRLPALKRMVPMGTSTIYRKMSEGTFPRNIPLGAGSHARGWFLDEIQSWLAEQAATREGRE